MTQTINANESAALGMLAIESRITADIIARELAKAPTKIDWNMITVRSNEIRQNGLKAQYIMKEGLHG